MLLTVVVSTSTTAAARESETQPQRGNDSSKKSKLGGSQGGPGLRLVRAVKCLVCEVESECVLKGANKRAQTGREQQRSCDEVMFVVRDAIDCCRGY